jgi:Holliday junction resolvase-like predicted endonuclease
MNNRRIDLGEYIIEIKYDEENGELDVIVLDELEEVIESINITNSEHDNDFKINLN